MTIQELDTYYDNLKKKLRSKKTDFELNKDRAHNTTIARFMLDYSSEVNMYCGEMSVFRNNFYKYINTNNDSLANSGEREEVAKCPETKDKKLGDILKEKLIASLKNFIGRADTQLNIILENFDDSYFKDLIDTDVFNEGGRLGKIRFYKLDDNLILKEGLSHVSYTNSNIVRMEKNQTSHEATCAVNVPTEIMEIWIKSFNSMRSVAQPISYPN